MHTVRQTTQTEEVVARRWETVRVSLLLLALLAIFFWKAVFLGHKLVPADLAYNDSLYLDYAPAGFTQPHNALLYDQAYQFYPGRVYTLQALRQGFLPFWNPYIYCGAPFMAEEEPAVFYPLNVLSYVFSAADTFLFTALARLFVAGLATYWFVRTIGGGQFGALLSSLSFTFGGSMVVWLSHQHTNVAAWLPALFLTVEWLHRKSNGRHVAFVALVMAAQLTGGRTELCLHTLTAAGVYYLFRVLSTWRRQRQHRAALTRLLSFSVATILGFALAAIQLLPFWEWLQESAILHWRTAVATLPTMRRGLKYWLAGIPVMVLPNVFGNPTWPGPYRSFLAGRNFPEMCLYVGAIVLCLAVVVTIARRRDGLVLCLAALGVLTLGAALRWPVFELVNRLPLFNISSPGRLRLIYGFCVSVLAGLGADHLSNTSGKSGTVRAVIGALFGFAALGIGTFWLIRGWLSAEAASPTVIQAQRVSLDTLNRAFSLSNVSMYWPVLAALAGSLILIFYLRRALSHKMMQVALLALVVADLFALGMDYHTTVREEMIFPETQALALVKNDKSIFRVAGTNTDLMPGTGVVHGLYDVRGLVFPESRYRELCQAMGGQDWVGIGILLTDRVQPRLLNLLNVRYLLTSSSLDADLLQDMTLLGTDGEIRVYRNLACLPRAFVVHRVRIAGDDQAALDILQDPEFDIGAEIVLVEPVPSAFAAFTGQAPGARTDTAPHQEAVEITRYDPNQITIRTRAATDGFLFLSDSYDLGWKAYVDGVEVQVYRANYAFRAIYVTAGQHQVDWVYTPPSFELGLAVTLLAALALAILLAGTHLPFARRLFDGVDTPSVGRGARGKASLTHRENEP